MLTPYVISLNFGISYVACIGTQRKSLNSLHTIYSLFSLSNHVSTASQILLKKTAIKAKRYQQIKYNVLKNSGIET